MARLFLVRHGESEWNALGRWQGQADPPLSELGRRQAAAAAKVVGAVDAVFASTLQRAHETAAIIAEVLGVGPVSPDADLMERDAGEWSGLTRAEIDERWPGYLELPADQHTEIGGRERSEPARRPPGWEPDEQLTGRALAAIGRIVAEVPDGDVLVVTHGGVIYMVEKHLGALWSRLANLEGRWLHAEGGSLSLGERALLVDPDDVEITVPRQL